MCKQYPVYGQRDPRWAKSPLGTSSSTLAGFGCLVTCLSMLLGEHPDDVNAQLVKAAAFYGVNDGRLKRPFDVRGWLGKGPRWVRDTRRYPNTPFPAAELRAVVEHLKAGNPAILEVDINPVQPDEQQHFVLGVGAFGVGSDQIVINDPWPISTPLYGDQVTLCPRYGRANAIALIGASLYEVV